MITLTFDDGVLNTYEVAFPIMEKYGVKGIAFIVTGILTGDVKTARSDNAPYMNLKQIKELHEAGWEIGSHSHSHPRFDLLSLEQTERELKLSKQLLESWGFEPTSFAFPYGHGYYKPEQVKLAKGMYSWVRTVLDADNPYKLKDGVYLDHFPPSPRPEAWTVYVLHLVNEPEGFEEWIKYVKGKIVL